MREKCDKCDSDILMGECSCGKWYESGHAPGFAKICEQVIQEFNKMDSSIFTADHFSGTCVVVFKGDFNMCEKVKEFILRSEGE